ncbi:MAG: LacI family transcriptional regulator [Peptococcaceae bacterium]|nr:LacI family transcriptional regulator [Peptococcaceae bacterium]
MAATIKDVADLAGVNPSTVSRVLNNAGLAVKEETRQRIMEAVRILNYKPNAVARSLRTRFTQLLGMVIPDISNPFFSILFKGAEAAASEKGFNIILGNTDDQKAREEALIQELRDRQVDGLILATAQVDGALENMSLEGYPYVFVNRRPRETAGRYVVADNIKGAKLAIDHLVALGHTRIAHISGPLYTDVGLARLEGYRLALKDHGLPFSFENVVESEHNEEAGYWSALELFRKSPEVTAIFAANDPIAIGVMTAVYERGLEIPGDISLVGYNDLPVVSKLRPPLTSVRLPLFEMGYKAAEMLIKIISGEPLEQDGIVLEPRLMVRESTARMKG